VCEGDTHFHRFAGAVKNLTDDGLSTREAGEILGISHETVSQDVKNLTAAENPTPIDALAALAEALRCVVMLLLH
jgi:hypothetical protein